MKWGVSVSEISLLYYNFEVNYIINRKNVSALQHLRQYNNVNSQKNYYFCGAREEGRECRLLVKYKNKH